jgi:hypothetical protein
MLKEAMKLREIGEQITVKLPLTMDGLKTCKRLSAEGAIAAPETPEAFGQLIANEIARWRPVISSGRVKAD